MCVLLFKQEAHSCVPLFSFPGIRLWPPCQKVCALQRKRGKFSPSSCSLMLSPLMKERNSLLPREMGSGRKGNCLEKEGEKKETQALFHSDCIAAAHGTSMRHSCAPPFTQKKEVFEPKRKTEKETQWPRSKRGTHERILAVMGGIRRQYVQLLLPL